MKLTLINVPWSNKYDIAVRFKTTEERDYYFSTFTNNYTQEVISFDFGDSIKTTVIINNPAPYVNSEPYLFRYNYLLIQLANDTTVAPHAFYFITNVKYLTANQIQLTLECDVITQYLMYTEFYDTLILRSHYNRFYIDYGGNPRFIQDGKLTLNEPLEVTKSKLISRVKLNTAYSNASERVIKWLDENVAYWLYSYMKPLDGISCDPLSGAQRVKIPFDSYYDSMERVKAPFFCCVTPVFKGDGEIRWYYKLRGSSVVYVELFNIKLEGFLQNNGGPSNIYNQKISNIPPRINWINAQINDITDDLEIFLEGDSDNSFVTLDGSATLGVFTRDARFGYSITIVTDYPPKSCTFRLNSDKYVLNDSFKADDIINSDPKLHFNPKIFNSQFKTYRLTQGSNFIEYDLVKAGYNLNGEYTLTQGITPDICSAFLGKHFGDNTIYGSNTYGTYFGVNSINDATIPYSVSQFDAYLSNNKNYLKQNASNLSASRSKSAVNYINGVAQFGISGGTNTNNLAGGINSIIDTANMGNQIEYGIDNMLNAPETLQGVSKDPFLDANINSNGYYMEEIVPVSTEINKAFNFMQYYGFTTNDYGNPGNNINFRKYYNYIQVKNCECRGDFTNAIRDKICSIFNNGVRFFNVVYGEIDFNVYTKKENYELILEYWRT